MERPQARPIWRLLPVVVAGGLLLRLVVAYFSEVIGHPDEIFQYLEQGHRIAFGYGIIPWEYRYGVRNWLLPLFIAGLLKGAGAAGMDGPDQYVFLLQVVACLLSMVVIPSLYLIGRSFAGESAGRAAALIACVWHQLLVAAPRLTPEVLGAYLLVLAVALALTRPTMARTAAFGAVCALTVALRIQYAPAVCVVGLLAAWRWRRDTVALGSIILGATAVTLLAGWLDSFGWGGWFASYINNLVYNQSYGISSIFGDVYFGFYIVNLTAYSGGVFLAAAVYCALERRRTWPLLVIIAAIIAPHTLIAHKENRFVFAAIPLFVVLVGVMFADLDMRWAGLRRLGWPRVMAGVLVSATAVWVWVGTHGPHRSGRYEAFLFLSREPAVHAVLDLSGPWYDSGGYYYLHQNVPLLFSDHVPMLGDALLADSVSHVVAAAERSAVEGFAVAARFGDTVVLRNAGGTPGAIPRFDTRNPSQTGVDGIFQPDVTSRW